MFDMQAPTWITAIFTVLVVAVAAANILLVRRSAPEERRARWTAIATIALTIWMLLHAFISQSEFIRQQTMPPRLFPVLAGVIAVLCLIAFSPLGRRLSSLPLALLVGLMSFRLPLEWILHELYQAGSLPAQMTWSGYNFDVVAGASALVLGLALWRGDVSRKWVWAWNIMGFTLLLVVMAIAVLSAPSPIRQFMNEPAVVLVFNMPYTWIVSILVATAFLTHLLIFRALLSRDA